MLVTVDGDGVATKVSGDPDHPITAGFLCGKVSNYLDRVYHPERLLQPLVRDGEKGAGSFRTATWEEALDRVADGLEAVSTASAARPCCRTATSGRWESSRTTR